MSQINLIPHGSTGSFWCYLVVEIPDQNRSLEKSPPFNITQIGDSKLLEFTPAGNEYLFLPPCQSLGMNILWDLTAEGFNGKFYDLGSENDIFMAYCFL